MKMSQLSRGRRLQTGAKRNRIRRSQTRYAGKSLQSQFKAAPRKPRPTQPYLSASVRLEDLI